jgi:hypothetical protein
LRIAMTASDVPTTTGAPDNSFEGVRFLGYPVFEGLVPASDCAVRCLRLAGGEIVVAAPGSPNRRSNEGAAPPSKRFASVRV